MKNDYDFETLSNSDLFQEHDLLKTILYKSRYHLPNEEVQAHYDDFNNPSYFHHLSPELDLNRIELILRRLKPFEIINAKGRVARYHSGTYYFQINKAQLEEAIKVITKEIKGRSVSANAKKVEFNSDTGEAKYFVNGLLVSKATFNPITNEYKIFTHFLQNNHKSVNYQDLIKELKSPRRLAEGADDKRRVKDVIDAIENKLGKDVIERIANGIYQFKGEVTYP